MRGYTWTSNQRPPPIYQEPLPSYQASRNSQHNTRQAHFNPPQYPTGQARHHNGHQEVVNNWNSSTSNTDAFAQGFQRNFGWYDGQQNQTFSQQPFTGQHEHYRSSNVVAHNTDGFVSDNPNADSYHARYNMQGCSNAHVPTQQNYRRTGPPNINVAHMYWAQYSDHGQSRNMANDNRDWSSDFSDNCRSYQQPQHRTAHFYPQQSGQQQTPRRPSTPKHRAQKNAVNKRLNKSQAGLNRKTSSPSNNLKQSSTEQKSKASPNVPAAPSPKNQSSTEPPTPQTKGVQDNKSVTDKQPSDVGVKNTSLEQSEARDASATDHSSQSSQLFSEPNLQSVVEPPSKRKKCDLTQTNYWNKFPSKNPSLSKDGKLQSALPGTCQIGTTEQNSSGQSEIQYVTDPAQCLEAVFALHKAFQQNHKAIAMVRPISQQTSNTEKIDDACKRVVDSPPLKIDAVWSLSEECDKSKDPSINADDKLSQNSSPEVQQDGRISPVSKTTNNIADPSVTQSLETDACQNDVQQSDCVSSETKIELSNVPVVVYTLEELKSLVKSMEMTESFAECTEKPESVLDQILNQYWNGDVRYILKYIRTNILHDVRHFLQVQCVNDDKSVVFESIAPENVKKVDHCVIVNNETCSSPQEFRSSWLNVDAQPDIEKVLSEPLSDYISVSKWVPDNICVHADNLCEKDPEVTSFNADEQSVRPDTGSFAEIVTPSAGNGRMEMAKEDKGHSNANICEVAFSCIVPSEQETSQKRGDSMQNHKLFANLSPTADLSLECRHDSIKETLSQEHIRDQQEQVLTSAPLIDQQVNLGSEPPHHNLLSVCPVDKPFPFVNTVSDCVKSTEDQSNFIDTWKVENISDDDSSGKMEVLTNSTDAMQVENVSKDVNLCNTETLANYKDTMQTESTAEDENLGNMEVITNSEDQSNFTDTWQVEDISDDDNSGNMETIADSTDAMQVENVSKDVNLCNTEALANYKDTMQTESTAEDENLGNMEVITNSEDQSNFTDTWQVEDISDDDNSGNMETIADSTDAMQVENVSENENSGNTEVLSNFTDAMQVEVISDDENSDNENSFNDCLLMDMTVLSSEDALKFFQQLENQPQCDVKNPELVAFSSSEPNFEYNQPKICSRCGTNTFVTSESTVDVGKTDLFCIPCWETAPSLDLAMKPCSPKKNKIDVVCSEPEELEQNCSLPYLKPEVLETVIASTVTHNAHQEAVSDKVVNSVPDKASEVQSKDFLTEKTKSYTVERSTPNKAPQTPSRGFPTENANKATKIQSRGFLTEKTKSDTVERSTPNKAPQTPSRGFLTEKPKSDTVERSTPNNAPQTPSRGFPTENANKATKIQSRDFPTEKPKSDTVERSTPNKAPQTPRRGFLTEKPKSDTVERSTPNKAPQTPSRGFLTEKTKSDTVERSTPNNAPQTPSRGFLTEKPKSDTVERSTPNNAPQTPSRGFLTEKPKSDTVERSTPNKEPQTPSRGFPTENANKATKIQSRDFPTEKPKSDTVERSTPNKAPQTPRRGFLTEKPKSDTVERSTPNKAPQTPSRGFLTEKPKSDTVERSNTVPETPSRGFPTEKPNKATEIQSRDFQTEKPQNYAVERSTPNKVPETPIRVFLTEKPNKAPAIQSRDFQTDKTKSDGVERSTTNKAPEIQLRDFQTENENSEKICILRSLLLIQRTKNLPSKSTLRSGDGSDDSVLFAPDIVLKKRHPQNKNHGSNHATALSPINLPVSKNQDCNSVINLKEPRQEKQDPPLQVVNDKTLQDHKEKVRDKGSCYLKPYVTTKLDRANKTPAMHSENLSAKKTVKKKVRFALYGSKSDHQCAAQGRRFSPPATLTVSSAFQDSSKQWSQNKHPCFPQGRCFSAPSTLTVSSASKDYSDVLSAKQKVHNQWSSTFIPKIKKTSPPRSPTRSPPRSPQKVEPQKKKPQKPQEVLKSNMPALKKQILYRAMLSSQETEQKHTKTLNG